MDEEVGRLTEIGLLVLVSNLLSMCLETEHQSMKWRHSDSLRLKKVDVQRYAGKIVATVCLECQGLVMIDFVYKGRTIFGNCGITVRRY